MVETPFAYNIILGRLALSALQVIASSYHQKLKFPMGNEVREVKGDQQAAHKCYVEMILVDQKR